MLQPNPPTISGFLPQADQKSMIAERVRGEYREMPGLALTLAQAGRLWSLDAETCADVLTNLVESGYLTQRNDGAYCRTSDVAGRPFRMARATIELADLAEPRRLA